MQLDFGDTNSIKEIEGMLVHRTSGIHLLVEHLLLIKIDFVTFSSTGNAQILVILTDSNMMYASGVQVIVN